MTPSEKLQLRGLDQLGELLVQLGATKHHAKLSRKEP